jgi:hypothetical protein
MKRIASIFIMLLAIITVSAQDITGKWSGVLSVTNQMGQTGEVRLNFNISATDNGYTSTLDSPDQNTFGYAVDSTLFKKPELTIKISSLQVVYLGTVVDEATMNGTFTQVGQSYELNMKKEE